MTPIVIFLSGCFVGAWIGLFIVGMCVAAGRADRGRE